VLRRSNRRFRPPDRLLWLILRRIWPQWRDALVLVQPATVERWRRDRCNRHWWRRSRLPGRPRIDSACRDLIGRLAEENALRGAPRIHGELLKLGVIVSERTVSRYLRERPKRPSHRLGAHSWQIISASSHSIPRRCHDTRRTLTMSPTCPVCHVAKRGCHAMRCTPLIRGAVVEWRDLRQPTSSRRCPIHDRVDDGVHVPKTIDSGISTPKPGRRPVAQ
jgi:hypothetical protein